MDHNGLGCGFAYGSDQPHLCDSIDIEIGERIGLAAHVARLCG